MEQVPAADKPPEAVAGRSGVPAAGTPGELAAGTEVPAAGRQVAAGTVPEGTLAAHFPRSAPSVAARSSGQARRPSFCTPAKTEGLLLPAAVAWTLSRRR